MKNKPYVKKFDANGVLLNPITKENPVVNLVPSNRGNRGPQYIILVNMRTSSQIRLKKHGNNRKNTTGGRSKQF